MSLDRILSESAKERPIAARRLAAAEEDLEWWYGPRVAELGESAAGYEPSSAGHVFDGEAWWRLHERMTSWGRRQALRRARVVGAKLGALAEDDRRIAAALYVPRGYPIHLRNVFAVERPPSVVILVGVVLLTEAAPRAFARAHGDKPPHGAQLAEWLDAALDPRRDAKHQQGALPRWAKECLEQARAMRAGVLRRYAGAQAPGEVD